MGPGHQNNHAVSYATSASYTYDVIWYVIIYVCVL